MATICPECKEYISVEEAGETPVCTTDGCDPEGQILNRV